MHNGIFLVGYFNTLHRAGDRAVDLGRAKRLLGGAKSLKLSTTAAIFQKVSLLIEAAKHVDWGCLPPLGAGLDFKPK